MERETTLEVGKMKNAIVRSVCYFDKHPQKETVSNVYTVAKKLAGAGYVVQTKRICSPFESPDAIEDRLDDHEILLSVGSLSFQNAVEMLPLFYKTKTVSFTVDLTKEFIDVSHVNILRDVIKHKPDLTFRFAYVFNNRPLSPYFPSAVYERDGFALGLQPTDLAEGCNSLEEWFSAMQTNWRKLYELFSGDQRFLGIDTSIAPLFEGSSSLIHFIKRLGFSFSESVTTDIYVQITNFLQANNPKPVGLCGLMMPCLEDFELAKEYEEGNFSLERNMFLSLHCGLGIDTYPIGVDENPKRIVQILQLVQGLSNKYKKPLSARFVSDGKAKIGERTNFQNEYLQDVVIRPL